MNRSETNLAGNINRTYEGLYMEAYGEREHVGPSGFLASVIEQKVEPFTGRRPGLRFQ